MMFHTGLMDDTRTVCMNTEDQCDYTDTFKLDTTNATYAPAHWNRDKPRYKLVTRLFNTPIPTAFVRNIILGGDKTTDGLLKLCVTVPTGDNVVTVKRDTTPTTAAISLNSKEYIIPDTVDATSTLTHAVINPYLLHVVMHAMCTGDGDDYTFCIPPPDDPRLSKLRIIDIIATQMMVYAALQRCPCFYVVCKNLYQTETYSVRYKVREVIRDCIHTPTMSACDLYTIYDNLSIGMLQQGTIASALRTES